MVELEGGLDTREIYFRVIEIANIFVKARAHLTIEALKDFNPTVAELGEVVRSISKMIEELAADFSDQNMAINAFQCSLDLGRLAKSVTVGDAEEMNNALDALERYPNGPY